MDLVAINDAIQMLEESDTTHENVSELASLYICRDNLETRLKSSHSASEHKTIDTLPLYTKYINTKRRYQKHEAIDSEVIQGIKDVCRELQELISTIYNNTDMHRERICIKRMIQTLSTKYKD